MGRAEGKIESYLIERVRKIGGLTRKLTYQGRTGAPDQMCILPGGMVIFVETKAAGKKLDPHQDIEIKKLKSLGALAYSANTKEQIDEILTACLRTTSNKSPD